MSGSGKTIGLILIGAGIIVGLVLGVWLMSGLSGEQLSTSGAILGLALGLIIILPLLGAGIYLFLKGGREDVELAAIRKERRILELVQVRGRVPVSDIALELQSNRDQVKVWIYDLVGKGLFSGYINWNEGILYSKDASQLKTDKCPNCGGQVELAGKGVVQCPFCGTEIFLS
jgi:hypothetical protein